MTTAPSSPNAVTVPAVHARIMLLLAGLQTLSFMIVAIVAAVPIPILDSLDMTGRYLNEGLSWQSLVQPWNQHLIVIPRLLLAADIAVTGGHMLPFVVLALLAWCGVFAVARRHLADAVAPGNLRLLAQALLLLVLFRAFLLESIVLNNGLNYPLAAISAVAAISLAARLDTAKPAMTKATLSALAALASSLCLANGILAIPIAALVAVRRSRSLRAALPFGAALAVVLGCLGLSPPGGPLLEQPDPHIVLQSMTRMFGAPWGLKIGAFDQAVGAVVLATAAATLILILYRQPRLDSANAFAAGLIAFGLGSALLVALGRPDLVNDMGMIGRYGLWPALVKAGIVLVLVRTAPIVNRLDRPALLALILALAVLIAHEHVRQARMYLALGADMQEAAVALRAGGRDPALLARIRSDGRGPVFDLYAARGLYGFR